MLYNWAQILNQCEKGNWTYKGWLYVVRFEHYYVSTKNDAIKLSTNDTKLLD